MVGVNVGWKGEVAKNGGNGMGGGRIPKNFQLLIFQ